MLKKLASALSAALLIAAPAMAQYVNYPIAPINTPITTPQDAANSALSKVNAYLQANPSGLPTNNPTFTGTLTGPNSLNLGSTANTTDLSTLTGVTTPLWVSDNGNTPSPDALYFGHPSVNAYTETAGNLTYENMVTSNLTISGTVTNHYGQFTDNLIANGTGTMNAELNQRKNIIVTGSGLTINNVTQNNETVGQNFAADSSIWTLNDAAFINDTSGTIAYVVGYTYNTQNNNTAANSFFNSIGYQCTVPTGTGSVIPINRRQCYYNQDPNAVTTTVGHYGARPTGGSSPTLSGCGTSPSLVAQSSDVAGTVTLGTGATGCTITFQVAFLTTPTIVVSSPTGTAFTSYTPATGSLTIVGGAAGNKFSWIAMDGF